MYKNLDMVHYYLGMVADLNNRSARFQLIAMLVEGEDERFFAPWTLEEAKGFINGNSFADLLESRKWLRGAVDQAGGVFPPPLENGCNEWLEAKCGDPDCEECTERPERP